MLQVRRNRLWKFLTILILSAGGISLILFALNSKLDLFYTPSEMLEAEIQPGYRIKLGGMVKIGSIEKQGTAVNFLVTDFKKEVPVTFDGIKRLTIPITYGQMMLYEYLICCLNEHTNTLHESQQQNWPDSSHCIDLPYESNGLINLISVKKKMA